MATISSFPFVRHLRSSATSYIERLVKGEPRGQAVGAAFWFRPLAAAISEVPTDDRELDAVVWVRTADLQQVSAPATVTYRFADPALAARRVDFSIDLTTGNWCEAPLERVGTTIHGAVTTAVTSAFLGRTLREVLAVDLTELASRVAGELGADPRLEAIGIEVVGVRFALLRPDADLERALQTPAREQVQQEADRATFERRALAVEREAAIGENELANQIELAKRQEQLIAQKGANARREAEDAASADAVAARAEAERSTALANARAEATRAVGQAEADLEAARIAAMGLAEPSVLLALALRDLTGNLPQIEQLVLTPDLLTGLLGKLSTESKR